MLRVIAEGKLTYIIYTFERDFSVFHHKNETLTTLLAVSHRSYLENLIDAALLNVNQMNLA